MQVHDLRFSVKKKTILDGVSLNINASRLTAIMGASGAGKTTLLSILAGQVQFQSGTIHPSPATIKRISQFVFQDDLIFPTMTVKEAITMSALLRGDSGRHLPNDPEKASHADQTIRLLNLEKCQDTIIGSPSEKGVSGGERKRCSIGMELVTDPMMLFLDEPTSGLDTFTAYNVINCLSRLAHDQQRTIICTLHQPSSDIFHLIDDLVLLSGGRVVYAGPREESIDYFAQLGYACPRYNNPADYFFMNILNETPIVEGDDPRVRLDRLVDHWHKHSLTNETLVRSVNSTDIHNIVQQQQRSVRNLILQFRVLFARAFKNVLRNKMIVKVRFFQSVFIALVIGTIYFDVSRHPQFDTQRMNRSGALYFLVINQFMSSATGVVTVFCEEKDIFKREHDAGYYGLPAYFLTKVIVETPHQVFFPFLVMTIAYWMIGLRPSFGHYLIAVMAAVLSSLNGMAMGMVAGAMFKQVNVGMAILMVILLPLMLFSGFLVNNDSIPVFLRWIRHVSPTKYAFHALMLNEFTGLTFKNCDKNALMSQVHKCSGDFVLQVMGMKGGLSIVENLFVLVSSFLLLLLLAYLALFRLTRFGRG